MFFDLTSDSYGKRGNPYLSIKILISYILFRCRGDFDRGDCELDERGELERSDCELDERGDCPAAAFKSWLSKIVVRCLFF